MSGTADERRKRTLADADAAQAPRSDDDRLAALAAAKAVHRRNADPLALTGRPKERKQVARERNKYLRGNLQITATRLGLSEHEIRTAIELRFLVQESGGAFGGIDFTQERVDGGSRGDPENRLIASMDGEAALRRVLVGSGMGFMAAEVVTRVCAFDETLTVVAIDFEENAEKKNNGGCSKLTRAYVSRLLHDGLAAASDYISMGEAVSNPRRRRMQAWMAEGTKVRLEEVALGAREGLPVRRSD